MGETAVPAGHGYFEHDADVGVIGRGPRVEDAFVAGAEAVFELTTRLGDVRPQERIEVAFEEADIELAFVTWLNRLIAESQARALALGRFALAREGASACSTCTARARRAPSGPDIPPFPRVIGQSGSR